MRLCPVSNTLLWTTPGCVFLDFWTINSYSKIFMIGFLPKKCHQNWATDCQALWLFVFLTECKCTSKNLGVVAHRTRKTNKTVTKWLNPLKYPPKTSSLWDFGSREIDLKKMSISIGSRPDQTKNDVLWILDRQKTPGFEKSEYKPKDWE